MVLSIREIIILIKFEERKIMIINNGVINIGDNNTVISAISYCDIARELNVLLNYTENKEVVESAIRYANEENSEKLKKVLKKIGKEMFSLIKELGLVVLRKYIEGML